MRTDIAELLSSRDIRPSPQRLAVYAALCGRGDHPTADVIFRELKPQLPTISKTTVLDALRRLQEAGLTRDVRCEEGELRFDGCAEFHAHFKCRGCGALHDLPVAGCKRPSFASLPRGFTADDEQIIYYGLCPKCNNRKKKGKSK